MYPKGAHEIHEVYLDATSVIDPWELSDQETFDCLVFKRLLTEAC